MRLLHFKNTVYDKFFLLFTSLVISSLLWGCNWQPMNATEAYPTQVTNFRMLSVKEHYDEALKTAKKWQAGAYLQSANVVVSQDNDFPRNLRLSYTFYSDNVHNEAFLVWIREDLTIETDTSQTGSSDRRSIEKKDWILDGMEALQKAQEYGGDEYLSKYRGVEIDLFLEHQNDIVVWRISYLRPNGDGGIHITVDAVTGQLVSLTE